MISKLPTYVGTQPIPLYRCRYAWNTWGVTVAEMRDEYGVLAVKLVKMHCNVYGKTFFKAV